MNGHREDAEATWRAFPVASDLTDEEIQRRLDANEGPETPEEYIAFVRYQAKLIPDVVISKDINPRKFDTQATVNAATLARVLSKAPETHATFLPDDTWIAVTLEEFKAVRQHLESIELGVEKNHWERPTVAAKPPNISDYEGWNLFCFGKQAAFPPMPDIPEPTVDTTQVTLRPAESAHSETSRNPKRPRLEEKVVFDEDDFSSSDEEVVRHKQLLLISQQLEERKKKLLHESSRPVGPHYPSTSILLQFDQPQTARVIRRLSTAYKRRYASTCDVEDAEPAVSNVSASSPDMDRMAMLRSTAIGMSHTRGADSEDDENGSTDTAASRFISPSEACWLYMFLARLDMPLLPEVAAVLRNLFQLCRQQRNELSMLPEAVEDETIEYIAALNVIIVILGHFFGQRLSNER